MPRKLSTFSALRLDEQIDSADFRAHLRAGAGRLLNLAGLLPDTDRRIVLAALVDGLSFAQIARLTALSWGAVRRRYLAAVNRLNSTNTRLFSQHLLRLTAPERELAVAAFVAGMSYRKLAGRFGVTLHAIRTRLARLRAQLARLEAEWAGLSPGMSVSGSAAER